MRPRLSSLFALGKLRIALITASAGAVLVFVGSSIYGEGLPNRVGNDFTGRAVSVVGFAMLIAGACLIVLAIALLLAALGDRVRSRN